MAGNSSFLVSLLLNDALSSTTEYVGVAVTLQICIRKVPSLNLAHVTGYPGRSFSWLFFSPKANAVRVAWNRPLTPRSKSLSPHYP